MDVLVDSHVCRGEHRRFRGRDVRQQLSETHRRKVRGEFSWAVFFRTLEGKSFARPFIFNVMIFSSIPISQFSSSVVVIRELVVLGRENWALWCHNHVGLFR